MKYLLHIKKGKEAKLSRKESLLNSYKNQLVDLNKQIGELENALNEQLKERDLRRMQAKKKTLLFKKEILESAVKNLTSEVNYLRESLEDVKERIMLNKIKEAELKKIRKGDCVRYRIKGMMTLSSGGIVEKVTDKYLLVREDDGLFRKVHFDDWIIWKSKGC